MGPHKPWWFLDLAPKPAPIAVWGAVYTRLTFSIDKRKSPQNPVDSSGLPSRLLHSVMG